MYVTITFIIKYVEKIPEEKKMSVKNNYNKYFI